MKNNLLMLAFLVVVSGCASKSEVFTWYHPQGGEYLFAFDNQQCTTASDAQGLTLNSDTDSEFFACMRARGYQLLGQQTDGPGVDANTTPTLAADG